jgi:pyruvate/2-oxoglutarate dehydrogenase complex dihydrolipoamide dehydrogenase (E3) component
VETVGPDSTATLTADLVVINTGLRSAVPPISGLDDVDYLTSTSIMELTELPEHLVILGGGYTGLEFAQAYRRFGSRVTIVERGSQLLEHEDEDIAAAVAAILRDEGIEVLLNAEVTSVERARERPAGELARVRGSDGDDVCSVRGSQLLVASGRRPNTDDLGLDAAGVRTDDRGYIDASERLETSEPGTYVIGDVKGGPASRTSPTTTSGSSVPISSMADRRRQPAASCHTPSSSIPSSAPSESRSVRLAPRVAISGSQSSRCLTSPAPSKWTRPAGS